MLHPGARWASKLWPPASWANLAAWFHDQGFQVAVTGSAADQELVAAIVRQSRAPLVNLAGRTSLAELAGVLRRARLAVTTDTGAMHLAAALGTPGGGALRPHRPLAHRPFRPRPPGGAPGAAVQSLLSSGSAPPPGASLNSIRTW